MKHSLKAVVLSTVFCVSAWADGIAPDDSYNAFATSQASASEDLGAKSPEQVAPPKSIAPPVKKTTAPSKPKALPQSFDMQKAQLRDMVFDVGEGNPAQVSAIVKVGKRSDEADRLRMELNRIGVPAHQIHVQKNAQNTQTEILLEALHQRRDVSGCSYKKDFYKITANRNELDPGVGCSTNANLAAMLDRKDDLTQGRGTRYSDGERAAVIIGEYRVYKAKAQ